MRELKKKGFTVNTLKPAGLMLTATSFLMTTGAALADVTPADVWSDWRGYMADFGYSVTADESLSGNDLTVRNLVLGIPMAELEGDVTMTLPEIQFSDNGDGTVSISMPEVMPISVNVSGSEPVSVDVIYTTKGLDVDVSGDMDDMTYVYSAAMMAMELGEFTVDGETLKLGTAKFEMADVAGNTRQQAGAIRKVDQTVTTGPFSYAMDFADPDSTETRFVLNGATQNLSMNAKMAIPKEMDPENMAEGLKAGFAIDGGYTFGPGNMNFNVNDRGEVTQGKTSSQGGSFTVAMDEGRLLYGVKNDQVDVEIVSPDLPFPISAQMRELGFEFLTPVLQSDAAQDFGLSMILGDFTMSDMIWGQFDPSGQLPRDPATIALDLAGQARLLFDLFDPDQMMAVENGEKAPGELLALTMKNLVLRVAGAELTGQGDFTFDNTDMSTYDGMPKPVGSIDLSLLGGNGLLDRLVAMGLFSEDDAMGIRMMSAAFVKPGEGDDHMTSTLEFNEQGHVLANGQRLK
ncbi:DUF2125 domain-containing protein [Roseovarius aestuarii]|nr:DUF2125 domain-containing protein [Roseovarius aestuarii]